MDRVDIVPASVVTQAMRGEHSGAVEPVGVQERWQLEGLVAADIMWVSIAQERHALCKPPQPPGLPDLKVCVQHDHQPCAIPHHLHMHAERQSVPDGVYIAGQI